MPQLPPYTVTVDGRSKKIGTEFPDVVTGTRNVVASFEKDKQALRDKRDGVLDQLKKAKKALSRLVDDAVSAGDDALGAASQIQTLQSAYGVAYNKYKEAEKEADPKKKEVLVKDAEALVARYDKMTQTYEEKCYDSAKLFQSKITSFEKALEKIVKSIAS